LTYLISSGVPHEYAWSMSKNRFYLVIAILVALVVGAIVYMAIGNETPKAKVGLPGGGKADVTPTDQMRVRTAESQPKIDPVSYRLTVEGLVDTPLSLTLDDIKALPAEERYVKLPCVEGWTEAGVWKGPRLAAVLDRAGVKKEAENVVFTSPGGYTTSLTLADIKATDPLLAYGVNGDQLPEDQGYPVRLVVPDRLGYKWIKWVTGIKLIKGSYEGYWESRGYSNDADASGR
jgi:DMSO/TMAO reductase YedYZ molybdopterin-dependent catalytic subunit